MTGFQSYYEILCVLQDASAEEIKSAFRKLALVHHPDKNPDSPESETRFKIILNAYTILSDPEKRREYDAYLKESHILKDWRNRGERASKSKITVFSGSPYTSAESVFVQLNYLLWEIEDFLKDYRKTDWGRIIEGKTMSETVLELLIFLDKMILTPGGFPDYFLESRKLGKSDPDIYGKTLLEVTDKPGHKPFHNVRDYFYNIRVRMDKFIRKAGIPELLRTVPETEIRIIDAVLEAEGRIIHTIRNFKEKNPF